VVFQDGNTARKQIASHYTAPPVIHSPFLGEVTFLYGNTASWDHSAPRDGESMATFTDARRRPAKGQTNRWI